MPEAKIAELSKQLDQIQLPQMQEPGIMEQLARAIPLFLAQQGGGQTTGLVESLLPPSQEEQFNLKSRMAQTQQEMMLKRLQGLLGVQRGQQAERGLDIEEFSAIQRGQGKQLTLEQQNKLLEDQIPAIQDLKALGMDDPALFRDIANQRRKALESNTSDTEKNVTFKLMDAYWAGLVKVGGKIRDYFDNTGVGIKGRFNQREFLKRAKEIIDPQEIEELKQTGEWDALIQSIAPRTPDLSFKEIVKTLEGKPDLATSPIMQVLEGLPELIPLTRQEAAGKKRLKRVDPNAPHPFLLSSQPSRSRRGR